MARPSTIIIIQKNIIQQFESLGIRTIINLQSPREHASCGPPLEPSGFSYDPNMFMERNIYYYNFAWKDYGDATLAGLLNMVKVVSFALTEGRVAIHCHAGLGRTGVLIACYLVYSLRVNANDAIKYVRLKRPGSVQTRGQILCVRNFAQFILPQSVIYYMKENVGKDKYMNEFTLQKFLRRQRLILHGYEERNFKYIPKIIHWICERILKLCACWTEEYPPSSISYTTDFLSTKLHGSLTRTESTYSTCSISSNNEKIFLGNEYPQSSTNNEASTPSSPNPLDIGDNRDSFSELSTLDGEEMSEELLLENKCFQELENQKNFAQDQVETDIIIDVNDIVNALLTDTETLDLSTKRKVKQYQYHINSSQVGWIKLSLETDINVLAALLFEWLEGLKVPVIKMDTFESIVVNYKQPELFLQKLSLEECCLIEYLLHFLSKIQPISRQDRDNLIKRLIAALSKYSLVIDNKIIPIGKNFKKIGDGTLACTVQLFESLFEMFEHHHSQKVNVFIIDDKLSDSDSDLENDFG